MKLFNKEKVRLLASEAYGVAFRPVLRKKIFYEAVEEGKRILLCTPQSKYHETVGAWWVDITQIQFKVMDEYDDAIIIFRLEGSMLCMFNFEDIKPYLDDNCIKYNYREKKHWKLYIYKDHIKVQGNDKLFNVKVTRHII